MLVKPRRHPDRIGKVEPESTHRQARVIRSQLDEWRDFQPKDSKAMGVLGIEHAQQGPRQRFDKPDHAGSSGKTCCRSTPRGSGLTHSTAPSGNSP